jgi:flagellar biosynthetic protein FliP
MEGNRLRSKRHLLEGILPVVLLALAAGSSVYGQEAFNTPQSLQVVGPSQELLVPLVRPEGLAASLQILIALTVLTLVPAIILMTTSFVRILVVLALLRQALGTQQLPPSQVITALAFFITVAIMTPVWQETYQQAIRPYTEQKITLEEAWEKGTSPTRRFMSLQIERAGNAEDVWLFLRYANLRTTPTTYEEVPLQALIPAFMLSELKTAFLIGFQIYLPFLIIDMVTAAVLLSLGMFMVPPAIISLPFKLALFVLLDGWHLVVGMLLESFGPFS